MPGDRISFSHLLPVVDLALLVLLVIVPITMTSVDLYEASKGATQIHIHSGQLEMSLPRDQIVPWAIRIVTLQKARIIMAINLPGALIQGLISLPSRTSPPQGWHPQALAVETWQALVFPFFALPFWWLVGCGLDGLFYKERFHWSLLLTGTLFSVSCLVVTLGFHFGLSVEDLADSGALVSAALSWTIAFAVLPIAWIAQSIRERRHPLASPDASF
jgi:hypothetical protein